ncbi:uncharacterized protein LOC120328504 [Styela clava]
MTILRISFTFLLVIAYVEGRPTMTKTATTTNTLSLEQNMLEEETKLKQIQEDDSETMSIPSRRKRSFGPCKQYLLRFRKATPMKKIRLLLRSNIRNICGKRFFRFTRELTLLDCADGFNCS